jgi:hypothetical protein
MNMKKSATIALCLLLLCVLGVGVMAIRPQTFGNDAASIQTVVSQQKQVEGTVAVLDIVDVENSRLASFCEGDAADPDALGLAVFEKDDNGNFVFQVLTRYEGRNTCVAHASIATQNGSLAHLDAIVSVNDSLALIEQSIDGGEPVTKNVVGAPSLTLFSIPERDEMEIVYSFYDINHQDIDSLVR